MRCDGVAITLQVMEQVEQKKIIHSSPKLDLQHPVLGRRTDVKLVSGGLNVKLFKQENKKWDRLQLSLSKFHWIKIDPEFFNDLSEDDLDQDGTHGQTVDNTTAEDEFKPQVCVKNLFFSYYLIF